MMTGLLLKEAQRREKRGDLAKRRQARARESRPNDGTAEENWEDPVGSGRGDRWGAASVYMTQVDTCIM